MEEKIISEEIKSSILDFCEEMVIVVDEVARSYQKQSYGEIGIVKLTFLSIIERVSRNLRGIIVLIQSEEELLENNRHPIMLILRALVEDLLRAAYLIRLSEDEESFANELNVINLDYIRYSEDMINQIFKFPLLDVEYNSLSNQEKEEIIRGKLSHFREKNIDLYINNDNEIRLKKPEELRITSNPAHLKFKNDKDVIIDLNKEKYSVSLLNKIFNTVGIENEVSLQIIGFAYSLYRSLSQYQHFTLDVSLHVLNRKKDSEMYIINRSFGCTYMTLTKLLQILGWTPEQDKRFTRAFEKYVDSLQK